MTSLYSICTIFPRSKPAKSNEPQLQMSLLRLRESTVTCQDHTANSGPAPPHFASAWFSGGQVIREHVPPTEMAQISTRLPRSISPKSPPYSHSHHLSTHPVSTWNVIFGRWSSVCRLPKTHRCFLFAGCWGEGRLGQRQVHLIKERMCQVSPPSLKETKATQNQTSTAHAHTHSDTHTHISCTNIHTGIFLARHSQKQS